ncbi:hypothetical protein A3D03_06645 [Candidatus Gottesmanbacteria bacterium RIFCSPHIGHO2_02_FULL_40_13]|uniref:DUF5615 domain-containing protein n=1 Tax=Candidatus Gottesmanbacteria bacterium RIFCSPHIGHO2_02_FULL_40_13 TaxID=1798384 RepID=A0A1F6ACA1_9BACT|nr:MAG: hypothetical protein A3D03_06645 [Candidatus Gottesmanbacteria bacterium RIFCSPHIGHO2_02_FULL_40_13]
MQKPRRYKLLLDENISPRSRFPILNSRHDVKHLVHDMKKSGISDLEVYILAKKTNRLIVTFNKKHFEKLAGKSKKTGIIAVSTNVSDEQIDKKITSLLSRKKKKELYVKLHYITLP